MNFEKYEVTIAGGGGYGVFENITDAVIFAEALANKYYADPCLEIIIERKTPVDGDKHE